MIIRKIIVDPEVSIDTTTPKVFLNTYIRLGSPKTFYEDTMEIQCPAGRRRSLDDLNLILKCYFPDWEDNNLYDVLLELYKQDYRLGEPRDLNIFGGIFFCPDIKKFVLSRHHTSTYFLSVGYIYNYSINLQDHPNLEYYYNFISRHVVEQTRYLSAIDNNIFKVVLNQMKIHLEDREKVVKNCRIIGQMGLYTGSGATAISCEHDAGVHEERQTHLRTSEA